MIFRYRAWSPKPRLQAALSTVAAAVVGVIVNLTLWFALLEMLWIENGVSAAATRASRPSTVHRAMPN